MHKSLAGSGEDLIEHDVMHRSAAENRSGCALPPSTVAVSAYACQWDLPLDRDISYAVKVLRDGGVETFESCEGGPGHAFLQPTIRFHGNQSAGLLAVSVAMAHGLPVDSLRRFWRLMDGELEGPYWELTFYRDRLRDVQTQAEATGLIA
jgi:hypothetical protein